MVAATGENPLHTGKQLHGTPEPRNMIITGATGDLAHQELIPSLYSLEGDHPLPLGLAMVGIACSDGADDAFRNDMCAAVTEFSRLRDQTRAGPETSFRVGRSLDLLHAYVTMRVGVEPEIGRVVELDIKNDPDRLTDEQAFAGHNYPFGHVVGMAARIAGRKVWVPD